MPIAARGNHHAVRRRGGQAASASATQTGWQAAAESDIRMAVGVENWVSRKRKPERWLH
jgi:hypothetical protein